MSEESPAGTGLLVGGVDLHVHTAPDVVPRSATLEEVAEEAARRGMAGIVAKSHVEDTADRAERVQQERGDRGPRLFGGVALNRAAGGLDPASVERTARRGGRIVWLPTIDARAFAEHRRSAPLLASLSGAPVEVTTDGGAPVAELDPVLSAVAEHDLVLASGHLAAIETLAVFERARELGVRRLLVTHSNAPFLAMTPALRRDLSDLGAVHELCATFTTPSIVPPQRIEDLARIITEVGTGRCVISSDGGQPVNPNAVEMLERFALQLRDAGVTDSDLHELIAAGPSRLVGL